MKQVKEHEESYDGNAIKDFVDLYIQVTRDSKKETEETFTKGNMFRVILEMFVAGSETTLSTLDWCFLFMAEFPEIQKKCQNEIDECLGNKHHISHEQRQYKIYIFYRA